MRQWTIDAFASGAFKGNPACVVEPFDDWPDTTWMKALAAENNQAETAFLLKTDDPGRFGLRWFTPALEVPLCGHATLASAHALFAEMELQSPQASFDTKSGPLAVNRDQAGYRMDFPADPPRRAADPPGLSAALGADPTEVWAGQYLIAVLASEEAVRELTPDIAALGAIAGAAARRGNVGVTSLAAKGRSYDVVSRFFAPGSGIAEDPATGSLHCALSPLFSDRLGRSAVRFHQAYPGRGGDMVCEHRGDRVHLIGEAVTVIESRLRL
ncbi:MAG: PhzF family phenazine biosynthesis protein [Caulobacteraceae bacterium]|nr:PhzF family phenazine biosynthesis protein [Caulobacteraceae bacterium]